MMVERVPESEQAGPREEQVVAAAQAPPTKAETSNIAAKGETSTAPKPHRITIILGLLSPFLALIALIMSALSYRIAQSSLSLSQQSLQVGQRAYLQFAVQLEKPVDIGDKIVWPVKVTLHNSGNTPAVKQAKDTQLLIAPTHQGSDELEAAARSVLNSVIWPSEDQEVTVGPKDSEEYEAGQIVSNKEAWRSTYAKYLSRGRTLLFRVSIKVSYIDVFNAHHVTQRDCDYLPQDDSTMRPVGCTSSVE